MTILVNKDSTSTIALTLTELADEDTPQNWLFRFNKDQGDREYLFFLVDVSPHPERYNEFEITEGTETGADVEFIDVGDYRYQAYQMPDTDDTDYTRGKLVEVGKAKVLESTSANAAYQATLNGNVYKPE